MFLLVSVDIDAAPHFNGRQLCVRIRLDDVDVTGAGDGLVLEEDAALVLGAGHVVLVGTAQLEALQCGAHLLTDTALGSGPACDGLFQVHQGSVTRFIHFRRPQGAVQMHISVERQQESYNIIVYQSFVFRVKHTKVKV